MPLTIKEKENCWEFLRRTDLPVFIYGMGDGADKILKVFEEYSIAAAGFFASDEFVRGHSFRGHLVHRLRDIEETVKEFIVVLAFGAGYDSLYSRIEDIAARHTLIAPDVPVVGGGLFTLGYALENRAGLERVYELLADDMSKKTFENIINFKISGKIHYLTECTADEDEIMSLLQLSDDEYYVDLGAYNGDTVADFIKRTGGKYSHIYAAEPDKRNFRKLERNITAENVTLINVAVWDNDGTLEFSGKGGRNPSAADFSTDRLKAASKEIPALRCDSMTDRATYIKMDVEGAEREAVEGARKFIEQGCKLNISLYHRTEDIFELPLLIHDLCPKLKLYIRHKKYIPAWETLLIGI